MQGRDNKPNYEGLYIHAYNRGANKSLIFLDEQDYDNFLFRAKILIGLIPLPPRTRNKNSIRLKVLEAGSVEVLCYCLMPNHFHFLIKQNKVDGVKQFLHRLLTSYSSYFNKKYSHSGHIFQGIYKSKAVLDDNYLTQLTAYIHFNPDHPFDWSHSSMAVYLGKRTGDLANPSMFMEMQNLTPERYAIFLNKYYTPQILEIADLLFEE